MAIVIRWARARRTTQADPSRIDHVMTSSSRADDPKQGMTLAELDTFVRVARQLGLPDETALKAIVGWHGQVRQITAEGYPAPPPKRPQTWLSSTNANSTYARMHAESPPRLDPESRAG